MNEFEKLLRQDINREEFLKKKYERFLRTAPPGHVTTYTVNDKRYYKLCISTSGNSHTLQRSIKPSETELLHKYADKAFAAKMVRILSQNLKFQKKLLENYHSYRFSEVKAELGNAYQLCAAFEEDPMLRILKKQRLAERNTFRSENLTQPTIAGIFVRSKSEAIIVNTLTERRIPFIYEDELTLVTAGDGPVTVRPDFVFTTMYGQKIVWEHLGMLSNEDYFTTATEKLKLYHQSGYYINSNLFLSTDTVDGRLDMAAITNIIDCISISVE